MEAISAVIFLFSVVFGAMSLATLITDKKKPQ